jgi:hypothetical protein
LAVVAAWHVRSWHGQPAAMDPQDFELRGVEQQLAATDVWQIQLPVQYVKVSHQ